MNLPGEAALRDECCRVGRTLAESGWAPGSSGNLSARLDDEQMLITASGAALGDLTPADLLTLPIDDGHSSIAPDGALRPSSETPMHHESYRRRPALNAVIHAHPPYTVALSLAGYDFRRPLLPEIILTLGEIGLTPYALPASEENARAIHKLAHRYEAIVLARHGTLTYGPDLQTALRRLQALEAVSQIIHLAWQLGELEDLAPAQVSQLAQHRKTLQAK